MKTVKGINLSDELWEWLKYKADIAQRSVSNLVEIILKKEMKKEESDDNQVR